MLKTLQVVLMTLHTRPAVGKVKEAFNERVSRDISSIVVELQSLILRFGNTYYTYKGTIVSSSLLLLLLFITERPHSGVCDKVARL